MQRARLTPDTFVQSGASDAGEHAAVDEAWNTKHTEVPAVFLQQLPHHPDANLSRQQLTSVTLRYVTSCERQSLGSLSLFHSDSPPYSAGQHKEKHSSVMYPTNCNFA